MYEIISGPKHAKSLCMPLRKTSLEQYVKPTDIHTSSVQWFLRQYADNDKD